MIKYFRRSVLFRVKILVTLTDYLRVLAGGLIVSGGAVFCGTEFDRRSCVRSFCGTDCDRRSKKKKSDQPQALAPYYPSQGTQGVGISTHSKWAFITGFDPRCAYLPIIPMETRQHTHTHTSPYQTSPPPRTPARTHAAHLSSTYPSVQNRAPTRTRLRAGCCPASSPPAATADGASAYRVFSLTAVWSRPSVSSKQS